MSALISPAILRLLNLLTSTISTLFAITSLTSPSELSKTPPSLVSPGERFYARMYAARSIPFGILASLLPFWSRGPAVSAVLVVAGVIQGADVAIGVLRRDRWMVIGAGVGTVVHFGCAWTIL